MSYSIDAITDSCYENTTCLINKFDIHDEDKLKEVEADITFAKATVLENNPISDKFNLEHYKAIHKFLFEDIYDWAGAFRKVDMSKKGTNFCSVDQLNTIANNCFKRLLDNNLFLDLDRKQFIDAIVDFYCVTNMLHPFREGNGRTQRIFISQLIHHNGYDFDFSDIDSDDLMIATIKSANGVTDFLRQLFDENISEHSNEITMI